ncbi:MAG: hypothetical protein RKE49_05130 [Oceanicaulis sp.]
MTDFDIALDLERRRYARLAGYGVSLPMAGAVYWAALAGLGLVLGPENWGFAAAAMSGLIFPLGLGLQGVMRSPFMKAKSPLSRPVVWSVLAINLLWPAHIAIILTAPEIAPLSLAIGMALHWPVIGWVYGSNFGIAHALVRTALVSAVWFALPDARFTVLPAAVALIYAATVIWIVRVRAVGTARAPVTGPLICAIGAAALFAATGPGAEAQAEVQLLEPNLAFERGSEVDYVIVAGRPALCLEGTALIEGFDSRRGAIQADVLNTGRRSFAYLVFHAEDHATYEAAYLRLHESGFRDAGRYTPGLNGETNRRVFGRHQIAAEFGEDAWITLRVQFDENTARVRIQGAEPVDRVIEDLALDQRGGRVGLASLFGACFSNVRVSTQSEPGGS